DDATLGQLRREMGPGDNRDRTTVGRLQHGSDWSMQQRQQLPLSEEPIPGGKKYQFITRAIFLKNRLSCRPVGLGSVESAFRPLHKATKVIHRNRDLGSSVD